MEEFPDPNIEKREESKKIILEIGTGERPVIGGDRRGKYDMMMKKGDHIFIALDRIRNKLKKSKESILKKYSDDIAKNTLFVNARGQDVPLKNETVSEVVLHNILGDPIINDKFGTQYKIIKEISRVLQEDGEVVILEDITPYEARGKGFCGLPTNCVDFRKIFKEFPEFEFIEELEDEEEIFHYAGTNYAKGIGNSFIARYRKKTHS
jgi:hypothetical protein